MTSRADNWTLFYSSLTKNNEVNQKMVQIMDFNPQRLSHKDWILNLKLKLNPGLSLLLVNGFHVVLLHQVSFLGGGDQISKWLTKELTYMGTQRENVRSSTNNVPYQASASHLVVLLVQMSFVYFQRPAQIWPSTSCTALIGTRHRPLFCMLTKSQVQSYFLLMWLSNKLKVWMWTPL